MKKKPRILITEHDDKVITELVEFLGKRMWNDEKNAYDQQIENFYETLTRAHNNLVQGGKYFKRLPNGEKHWFDAECDKCGWYASSEYLLGGHSIADTGDYSDTYCPVCGNYC